MFPPRCLKDISNFTYQNQTNFPPKLFFISVDNNSILLCSLNNLKAIWTLFFLSPPPIPDTSANLINPALTFPAALQPFLSPQLPAHTTITSHLDYNYSSNLLTGTLLPGFSIRSQQEPFKTKSDCSNLLLKIFQ